MVIKIFINNIWLDITNNVESSFQLEERCDEVFSLGTMKAWLDIPYNIPPYTLMKINDEYYLCSSQSTRYLTYTDLYVHDIQVLEASAILACYILNSKSFSVGGSNDKDVYKLNIIFELIKQKYGVNIYLSPSNQVIANKEQEFTFGPGTTAYDALLAIAKTYNCIPKVDYISNTFDIMVYFLKLGDENSYDLTEENITNEIFTQNTDNYCEILEAEITNVIDRTDKVLFEGLTTRSEELEMTDKTAKLLLPTRIEKVDEFYVDSGIKFETSGERVDWNGIYIKYKNYNKKQIDNLMESWEGMGIIDKSNLTTYVATYETWRNLFNQPTEEGLTYPFDSLYNEVFSKYAASKEEFYKTKFYYQTIKIFVDGYFLLALFSNVEFSNQKVNISDRILSKDEYELLTLEDRPKYCYYTPGTNVIDGMMETYRNDIWNVILNKNVRPFLNYAVGIEFKGNYGNDFSFIVKQDVSVIGDDVRKKTFDVVATTITNPFVSSKKSVIPLNQAKYTPSARSYDKGANNIDFDKMIQSLQKSNDMLGLPELALEYDLTKESIFPKAGQKVGYKGKNWYISSVIYYYRPNRTYCIMNLVNSFSKIADAIGVETQFNTTPNPLNNIIERPVYYELESNVNIPNSVWMKISIRYKQNYGNFSKVLFKRATVMKHDNVSYLYVEALDQYSIGKQTTGYDDEKESGTIRRFAVYDVGYVNEENEAYSYQIDIVKLPKLTLEDSYKIPEYEGTYETLLSLPEQILYKDAREKITFTIKVINNN